MFFSCDQAALWMVFSVHLSICPSVTPFWLCSHHGIIMKFSGVITNDQGKVEAKGESQRSKVKVTEVTTQLNRFRTVTPVGIHIWWWNDAYSLMLLRRGALLFFKVICQISRSHGSKNVFLFIPNDLVPEAVFSCFIPNDWVPEAVFSCFIPNDWVHEAVFFCLSLMTEYLRLCFSVYP